LIYSYTGNENSPCPIVWKNGFGCRTSEDFENFHALVKQLIIV